MTVPGIRRDCIEVLASARVAYGKGGRTDINYRSFSGQQEKYESNSTGAQLREPQRLPATGTMRDGASHVQATSFMSDSHPTRVIGDARTSVRPGPSQSSWWFSTSPAAPPVN